MSSSLSVSYKERKTSEGKKNMDKMNATGNYGSPYTSYSTLIPKWKQAT